MAWMVTSLPSESGPESYNLLQLAALNGAGQISNPHTLGYRGVPLVDASGQALGERQLAGLRGQAGELSFLLWPQARLKPGRKCYRVDALVALRRGSKVIWSTLEVDGPLHDPEWDELRQSLLRLDPIRLTTAQVRNHQSARIFLAKAEELLTKVGA